MRTIILSAFFLTSIFYSFAQEVVFSGSAVSLTVVHKTPQSSTASVTLVYNVKNLNNPTTGVPYVCGTDYSLFQASNFHLGTGVTDIGGFLINSVTPNKVECGPNNTGLNITCTFDLTNIDAYAGVFNILPKIQVRDNRVSRTRILSATPIIFTLGYAAEWGDLSDMTASGSSVKRSVITPNQTYGVATTVNEIEPGQDGVIEIGADIPGTTGQVFAVIGQAPTPSTFNTTPPASSGTFYLWFNKTSATTSSVTLITPTGSTLLSGVLATDRIVVYRESASLRFLRNRSNVYTNITGVPSLGSSTVALRLSAVCTGLNNGLGFTLFNRLNNSNDLEASLERELSGVDYPCTRTLNFHYNEEYQPGLTVDTLHYRILDLKNETVQRWGNRFGVRSGNLLQATRTFGDNRYRLNVSSLPNGTYVLEVLNEKAEHFYLRFTKNDWSYPAPTSPDASVIGVGSTLQIGSGSSINILQGLQSVSVSP